jgi:hypothetical protein
VFTGDLLRSISGERTLHEMTLAFELGILYDKAERRIEISATVSEAIANAFEKQKALPKEDSLVVVRDIAGAQSVSRYDAPRIREQAKCAL